MAAGVMSKLNRMFQASDRRRNPNTAEAQEVDLPEDRQVANCLCNPARAAKTLGVLPTTVTLRLAEFTAIRAQYVDCSCLTLLPCLPIT